MSQLDNIVNVVIDVQTQTVAQANFGTPLIVSQFLTSKTSPAFTRAREYASLTEMTADGWVSGDDVYKAARAVFSQNPRPTSVIVGRRDAGDADWAAALNAIQLENDAWYAIVMVPAVALERDDEIIEIAAWTETAKKIFFAQSDTAGIISGASTTDVAYLLKAAGYDRTALVYRANAKLAEFAEAGWVGEGLPFDPGSSTWSYKTLAGITPDTLTTTAKTATHTKNANTYTLVAGANITEQGKVASGEWIDVIIGIDWLTARLQETVYSALVNNRKIPYDDAGITVVAGLVQGVLEEAARKGVLQLSSIVLTVPKYADIPTNDKNARRLPDVTFTALLQGAIHFVEINGTVSV